jgi:hypothetical protein
LKETALVGISAAQPDPSFIVSLFEPQKNVTAIADALRVPFGG